MYHLGLMFSAESMIVLESCDVFRVIWNDCETHHLEDPGCVLLLVVVEDISQSC